MTTEGVIKKLAEPLDAARVHKLDGNSYLAGHDVIRCANEIFGYDGWEHEADLPQLVGKFEGKKSERYVFSCRVTVTALGVSKTDVGTGISANDSPDAIETAIKGSVTDGTKRAFRHFGTQFGLSLYAGDEGVDWWERLVDIARAAEVSSERLAGFLDCEVRGSVLRQAAGAWLDERDGFGADSLTAFVELVAATDEQEAPQRPQESATPTQRPTTAKGTISTPQAFWTRAWERHRLKPEQVVEVLEVDLETIATSDAQQLTDAFAELGARLVSEVQ